ncbi:unnamed protein product [Caenorhabditis bovis]|uniref:Uncharacterized protein n=1 Tax=Caenorhabditis bovis TaxID=2654633 RepID=A0A8S1F9I9_9PELO|nr:unnamed protein product [Caenorhabditis bovis]
METDVELHRRIVAAASRLATDKNTNKSVRKKRQKDLQAARQKLNRLEQGLQQMRYSASKPDISSIASDASSNSWSANANGGPMTIAMTKSCPTTPRGSIPDLSRSLRSREQEDEENENEERSERIARRAPSALSRHSLQQRYSGISSSSTTSSGCDSLSASGLPPRPMSRKAAATQCGDDHHLLDNPLMCDASTTNPLYENVGYRSTSYRSSYRQAHYPTIQDEHVQRKRAQSAHTISTDNGAIGRTSTYSIPLNDAAQKFAEYDEVDDCTPTSDCHSYYHGNPNVRRLTSSISCQAGFATASLDRRYAKQQQQQQQQNGNRMPMNNASDDMCRQNVTTRITTFPVAPPHTTLLMSGKPYSASELSNRNGILASSHQASRTNHQTARGSLPTYTNATAKMGISTNPQMEALLSYYKQQQQQQKQSKPPKTATIV